MKSLYKILWPLLLFSLLFSGCENLIQSPDEPTAQQGVTLYLSVQGDYQSTSARTIEPGLNPDISGYDLVGSLDGAAETPLAHFTELDSNAYLNLQTGTWNFTLYALNSQGERFLAGDQNQIPLIDAPVNLNFTLTPLETGTGTVEISLTWPASVEVSSVVPTLNGVESTPIDTTGLQNCIYSDNAVKGGYLLFLSLRNSEGTEIASIPEYVKFLPNMTSEASYNLTEGDFNSPPAAPGDFSISSANNIITETTGSLDFIWTDNSSNEANFEIQYSADSGSTWQVLDNTIPAASEASNSDLTRGGIFQFRLRAVNPFGNSDWTAVENFTVPYLVQFSTDGGSEPDSQEVLPGGIITPPADPSRNGDEFNQWCTDDTFAIAWDFATDTVSGNTTIYAGWTMVVEYLTNLGKGTLDASSIGMTRLYPSQGETITLSANTYARVGYDFVGWSTEPLGVVEYTDEQSVTLGSSGLTLYARWNRSDASPVGYFTLEDVYLSDEDGNKIDYDGNILTDSGDWITIAYGIDRYNNTISNADIVIPDVINGKPVTYIKSGSSDYYNAFHYQRRDYVKSVYIPEALIFIGSYAFYNGSNLEAVDLSQNRSLISIENHAFYNCDKLSSFEYVEGINNIGNYSFYSCGILESPVFPESLKIIGQNTYQNGTFENVTLNSDLMEISDNAFNNCDSLMEVTFPSTLTTLGDSAFSGCNNLQRVEFTGTLSSIQTSTFNGCPNLTEVILPEGLRSIGNGAFNGCSSITNIDFGDDLETIGSTTFQNCTSLTELILPDSMVSIGESAFASCTNLATIDFGNGLSYIARRAFFNCDSLTTLRFPDSLRTIQAGYYYSSYSNISGAFDNCNNLQSVFFNEGLETIGARTFENCYNLKEAILPDTVSILGDRAFLNNDRLMRVQGGSGLSTIGINAFNSCEFLEEIDLSRSVITSIPNTFALGNNRLVSVLLPDGVTSIGVNAFKDCSSLPYIDLPDSLLTIGNTAFQNCSSLFAVDFGPVIETIGTNAFDACSSLEEAILPDTLTSLGLRAFLNCSALESVDTGDGLTLLDQYTFQNCSSLKTVVLSSNLQSIERYAFDGCTRLETVNLAEGIRTIDDYAFQNCERLTDLILPEALTFIGLQAFYNCDALVDLQLPESFTTMEASAFEDCDGLTDLTLNGALFSIPESAFSSCSSLERIDFAEGLDNISTSAFKGCSSLKQIEFPNSLTSLGDSSFRNNSRLEKVELGAYISTIGGSAFQSCITLNEVRIEALTPPALASGTVFDGHGANRTFYVPDFEDNSIQEAYQAAVYWDEYTEAIEEGNPPVVINLLTTNNYAIASQGVSGLRGLALNSSGELFATYSSSDSDHRVIGPITQGSDLYTTPVYATGGADKPSFIVFDGDDNLYEGSDYIDTIYRVSSDGGVFSAWISIGGNTDYDPCWGGIAPAGFDGPNVNPGELVIVDRDYPNNRSFVFSSSTSQANSYKTVFNSNGNSLYDAPSAAFSDDTLYIADLQNGLFTLDALGNITQVSTIPARCVAVHPGNGKVYFADNGPTLILRVYDPTTGLQEVAGKINNAASLSWRTMLFTPDGSSLLIPAGDRILEIIGF